MAVAVVVVVVLVLAAALPTLGGGGGGREICDAAAAAVAAAEKTSSTAYGAACSKYATAPDSASATTKGMATVAARHVMQRIVKPRFLSETVSSDVASNVFDLSRANSLQPGLTLVHVSHQP
jgi:type II secretory pathway pseudopilin PulG